MRYFASCQCIDDVKKLYHQLVVEFHPDNNLGCDTTKIMQEINAEYMKAFESLKNIHRNVEGDTYTSNKETDETAEDFADIIDKIIHMVDVKIEIIGSWVWISGNTKFYKEILKEAGFHWSSFKKAWSYHKEPFRKRSKRKFSMDELRDTFGSEEVQTQARTAIG